MFLRHDHYFIVVVADPNSPSASHLQRLDLVDVSQLHLLDDLCVLLTELHQVLAGHHRVDLVLQLLIHCYQQNRLLEVFGRVEFKQIDSLTLLHVVVGVVLLV
jgi:hypothetical protein